MAIGTPRCRIARTGIRRVIPMDTVLSISGIVAVTMADTGGLPTGTIAHTTDRLVVGF